MSKKPFKLILALVAISLVTSACTVSTSSTTNTQSVDSSIFVSADRGDTWRALTAVPSTTGRAGSIAEISVNMMTMDPEDSKAVYLASYDSGLFYTYDVTAGWNEVKTLPRATISDVQVDPKSKCIVYAAVANRVYRSSDCSRTWTQIYFDNNTGVIVNTIAIDHYNTSNIYIGTSRGEIIKTIDSGNSWRTIQRLDDSVTHLIISPLDSRLVFVATIKNNIFSFKSNTNTDANDSADLENNFIVEEWTDLNEVLRDFNLGSNFKDIIVNSKDGTMFLATAKVILCSKDNGFTWENVNLIQPEKEAIINSLAVNPDDSNDIYYTTNTTFFRSTDGGATWTTKKLPTKRAGRELLIDFKNTNMIYLGTKKAQ
ncbi:MAG: WD40/YVTN/BNR-like repeat-containing protein [Patescibacteria group bacterium]